jgi:hypothetical protein
MHSTSLSLSSISETHTIALRNSPERTTSLHLNPTHRITQQRDQPLQNRFPEKHPPRRRIIRDQGGDGGRSPCSIVRGSGLEFLEDGEELGLFRVGAGGGRGGAGVGVEWGRAVREVRVGDSDRVVSTSFGEGFLGGF